MVDNQSSDGPTSDTAMTESEDLLEARGNNAKQPML